VPVTGERGFATAATLTSAANAALGPGHEPVTVDRLRGGTKKGVYRLTFDDASTAIVYVWDPAEDYWPDSDVDLAHPFSHASGIELFESAHRQLDALGARTPRLHLADRSGQYFPADIAVVEDIPGETLEARLWRDPAGTDETLGRLADALDVMQRHRASRFGKVALLENDGKSRGRTCEGLVLARAVDDLDEAAARDQRIADAHHTLAEILHQRAEQVRPRSEYGLIHGELGPDHVLVDEDANPVLIDIEGLMFFDIEWEHVFLRTRFGEHYPRLHRGGLDEHRLSLYELAMRLSLVAGPLRLLDGDFPDRAGMLQIAEYNLQQALTALAGPAKADGLPPG
jgi:hypothetical protein